MSPNDDGSSPSEPIRFPINFFGTSYDHVYVNNNGNLTFTGPLGTYTPADLSSVNTKIIAPFWADVDTRGAGARHRVLRYHDVQGARRVLRDVGRCWLLRAVIPTS